MRSLSIIPVALLMLAVGLVAAGCDTEDEASISTPTPGTTRYYYVRQWADTGLQMTYVASATKTASYSYWGMFALQSVEAPPGSAFVHVAVTVSNTGDTPLWVDPEHFRIEDSRGRRFAYAQYVPDKSLPSVSLDPGRTTHLRMPFLVPHASSGLELTYVAHGTPPVLTRWPLGW